MGNLLKYFETRLEFDKSRVAKDPENSPVTVAGVTDVPTVKWGHVVFIGETGEIWTHGKFMGGSSGASTEELEEIKRMLGDVENLLAEL